MTDLTHLIGRLRELADWPHDVAGAQDDIRQAADALQSLTARVAGMEEALAYVDGCFNAALVEGWIEAMEEGDRDRIRDIWQRRISYAWSNTLNALNEARAALNPVEGE